MSARGGALVPPSDVAARWGAKLAARIFDGRTGHGRSERVVYRQMREHELAAWLAASFDAGARHGRASGEGAR